MPISSKTYPYLLRLFSLRLLLLATLLIFLQACGYHHPGATRSDGKQLKIAVANWQNRTGVLGLESDQLQTMVRWFSKGNVFRLSDQQEADYFLTGTLESLRSPGQSYTSADRATQLQARMRVSYQLKDGKGNILLEEKSVLWTESYAVGGDAIRTEDNRRKALDKLLDDIAKDIYLQILVVYDAGDKL